MYSRIRSAVCVGIEGREVFVETDISKGLPGISIVGLASTTVMESKERIKSSIINSGFDYPRTRITVNLMPAELKKNSAGLDLPMAAGILISEMMAGTEFSEIAVIGELTLDGQVREVKGALPMLMHLKECGASRVVVPAGNTEEALISGIENIYPVKSLRECMMAIVKPEAAKRLSGGKELLKELMAAEDGQREALAPDFGDISGQENAKRALLIAAAGRHGLLMIGSPGCGKTMLAGRIPGIMPAMDEHELIQTAAIRSIAGLTSESGSGRLICKTRPFRHPHHTIGPAGLLGGGSQIALPGEITLAHNGVLFLDEICEFNKHVIDGLRIPLEEKSITHFRKGETYTYPCDFQLVMASNPCPCGFHGDPEKECRCTQADIERYQSKLSGPVMDRIDMKINMERVTYTELTSKERGMNSQEMRNTVIRAREYAKSMGRTGYNCDLTNKETEEHCRLAKEEKSFMREAYTSLSMSPRSYVRTLRVARTIADIAESESVKQEHLAEALSYRMP